MSKRQSISELDREKYGVSRANALSHAVIHGQGWSSSRQIYRQYKFWVLPGVMVLSIVMLIIFSHSGSAGSGTIVGKQRASLPALTATGAFHEYPLPRADSEVMRPAIDHEGRIWFGAMGQNALVVFDPKTERFQYLTPPHGRSGIMGVQVAPDDTIWFAEQYANYIGHFFPATDHYQIYPLPWLTVPDPGQTGQSLTLPYAPNELAFDRQGNVWFTEFNADRLGRLDPQSGHITQYLLAAKASVQTLYPYGVTVDFHGMVWFSEAGTSQVGRIDPATGVLHLFEAPGHVQLMEVATDPQGTIWITSFTPGLLFRLDPETGNFTSYTTPSTNSALYGLLVTPSGDVWVTILSENVIARLDIAAHQFIYYHIPAANSQPLGLVMDARDALWFTGVAEVGELRA
jgi:virginiamycin B lyase